MASIKRGFSDSFALGLGIVALVGWDLGAPWIPEAGLSLERASDTLKTDSAPPR